MTTNEYLDRLKRHLKRQYLCPSLDDLEDQQHCLEMLVIIKGIEDLGGAIRAMQEMAWDVESAMEALATCALDDYDHDSCVVMEAAGRAEWST